MTIRNFGPAEASLEAADAEKVEYAAVPVPRHASDDTSLRATHDRAPVRGRSQASAPMTSERTAATDPIAVHASGGIEAIPEDCTDH